MSASEFFGDILHGEFSHAWKRLQDFWGTMPSWLRNFASKMVGKEVSILDGLLATATTLLLKDIANISDLKTADIVAQAKTIYQSLKQQNIDTYNLQDVFAALNAALSESQADKTSST